jgi:hypothetical protein
MMDEIYKSEKKEPKELLNYVIGWNVSTKLIINVTTLTLGSRPRQRLAKVWAKSESWESDFMLLGM